MTQKEINNFMVLTPYDIALIGGGFTIIGGLIGALTASHTTRRQERLRLGTIFRDSFTEALRLIDIVHPNHSHEYKSVYDILTEAYPKHKAVAIQFEQTLGRFSISSFRKQWAEYCCYDQKFKQPTFSDYKATDHDKELNARDLAKDRIYHLLSFAKIK